MAYNANTNWDNEKKYLESLVNSGNAGTAAWATNQMKELSAAQSQYGSTSTPATSSPSSGTSVTPTYTYTPTGTHNDATIKAVSDADTAKINQYKADYEAAKAAGDENGMAAAHAAAEAIRKQYNYLGGDDGSEYIELPVEQIFDIPSWNYDSTRPTYDSKYEQDIDALLDQILNRDDFSYNYEEDPLYAQYKQQYLREGERAMNDTLAAAAANAGGMNSYAISAAQQANNYYSSQLNDKIPQLYEMAYQMYLDDIDGQVRDLGLLTGMDDTQYGRYRDTMGDWENDRDFSYNKYRDDMGDYFNNRDFDYGVGRDQIADSRYETEWEYNTGMNDSDTAYKKAMDFLDAGVMPSADILSAAGISTSEAQAYLSRVAGAKALSSGSGSSSGSSTSTSTGSGSGSGGGSYNNGSVTTANIKALQTYLGVTADGKWGSESQAAAKAKGLSTNADEAWKAYNGNNDNSDGHEIWGGQETDNYYDVYRVARQMYSKNDTDGIANYLADRILDGTITKEEAYRIADSYGIKL